MLEKETKDIKKKRYEPPTLLLLGDVDQGSGWSCSDGDGVGLPTCVGGSVDALVCGAGIGALAGGCQDGSTNFPPY